MLSYSRKKSEGWGRGVHVSENRFYFQISSFCKEILQRDFAKEISSTRGSGSLFFFSVELVFFLSEKKLIRIDFSRLVSAHIYIYIFITLHFYVWCRNGPKILTPDVFCRWEGVCTTYG